MNLVKYCGFIYRWNNKINKHKYVGSHIGILNDGYIGSGIVFNRAVKKYGIKNFEREILEFVYNKKYIRKIEQKWLDKLNCANDRMYYNISEKACGFSSNDCKKNIKRWKEKDLEGYLQHQRKASNSPNGINNINHFKFGPLKQEYVKQAIRKGQIKWLKTIEAKNQMYNRGIIISDSTNPNSVNNPNHPSYRKGGLKAADPNNPNSVNNPNHPDYGKGVKISNEKRRKNAPKGNWKHISGIKEKKLGALDMSKKYKLTAHFLRMMLRGEKEIYRGWILE
jgi:hypothetical protein